MWEEANKQMNEIFFKEHPDIKDVVMLLRIQMRIIRQLEDRMEELAQILTQPMVDNDFLARREEALNQAESKAAKWMAEHRPEPKAAEEKKE